MYLAPPHRHPWLHPEGSCENFKAVFRELSPDEDQTIPTVWEWGKHCGGGAEDSGHGTQETMTKECMLLQQVS